MDSKRCYSCKEIKPLNEFGIDNSREDKRYAICKDCRKKYYQEHKEEVSEYKRGYYLLNREDLLVKRKVYSDEFKRLAKEHFGNTCFVCKREIFKTEADFAIHHKKGTNDLKRGDTIRHPEEWKHCYLLCKNCHLAIHHLAKIPDTKRKNLFPLVEELSK